MSNTPRNEAFEALTTFGQGAEEMSDYINSAIDKFSDEGLFAGDDAEAVAQ